MPAEGTPEWDGLQVYLNKGCTQCHTVDFADNEAGVADNLIAGEAFNGPNLTHFGDRYRTTFAGAVLPEAGEDYTAALTRWLADPPSVKPGSYMPDLGLTQAEIDSLIAWLGSNE